MIRICARYGNLDILEEGYGINLLPLATFSLDMYGDDPCTCFALKGTNTCSPSETELNIKMHKAISVIQFKVEGQLAKEHPEFQLESRNLLHLVDYGTGSICLNGTVYEMLDSHFPTVDPQDPYRLTAEEELIMERLVNAFRNCEKLQQHMRFLLAKGNLYKVYNGNLLYHGCIPLNEDGSFKEVEIYGRKCKGKALYECLDSYVRQAFVAIDGEERKKGRDICWYIWLHENSPLFGKDKMATFERYLPLSGISCQTRRPTGKRRILITACWRRKIRLGGSSGNSACPRRKDISSTGMCRLSQKMGKIRSNAMAGSWSLTEDSQRHIKKKQGLQAIR